MEKSSIVPSGNVIYILNDQDQHLPPDHQQDVNEDESGVYQILGPDLNNGETQEEGNIYQIIETSDETIVGDEDGKEYTETITIVSEENDILSEEIIYVANEEEESGAGPVTFMQV